jgi:hypothetical protein
VLFKILFLLKKTKYRQAKPAGIQQEEKTGNKNNEKLKKNSPSSLSLFILFNKNKRLDN